MSEISQLKSQRCSCPASRWQKGHERVKPNRWVQLKGQWMLSSVPFVSNAYKDPHRSLKQPDPSMELELRARRRRRVWVRI